MQVEYGQLWTRKDKEDILVIVTGTLDFIWFKYITSVYQDESIWDKVKEELFVKKFEYSGKRIKKGDFWKRRSNGVFVEIMGLKDDGYKKMEVYYDLNRVSISTFLQYFDQCSLEERIGANVQKTFSIMPPSETNRMDKVMEEDNQNGEEK